jgi:hypothetical protein
MPFALIPGTPSWDGGCVRFPDTGMVKSATLDLRREACTLENSIVNQPENDAAMQSTRRANARLVFFTFLLTFIASRILVFLIMSRRVPDLYLHVGGTHVHHLNYGIFLLGGVGAYLLFAQPTGNRLGATAIAYGIGLGLTFDEFGMWIHLGGSYWQRASFDAVAVVIGILGFYCVFPFGPFPAAAAVVAGRRGFGWRSDFLRDVVRLISLRRKASWPKDGSNRAERTKIVTFATCQIWTVTLGFQCSPKERSPALSA